MALHAKSAAEAGAAIAATAPTTKAAPTTMSYANVSQGNVKFDDVKSEKTA